MKEKESQFEKLVKVYRNFVKFSPQSKNVVSNGEKLKILF